MNRTVRCTISLLLLCIPTLAKKRTVVDLSVDLATSSLQSTGAQRIRTTCYTTRSIRRALVLEHGRIVADYVRDGKHEGEPFDIVDPDEPYEQWSATKAWTCLMVGLLVESKQLSLDETLGSIWPNHRTWRHVPDAEFRKKITIESLLTMTSGMADPPWHSLGYPFNRGNGGGATLEDSLSYLNASTEGNFSYLLMCNILSYVIQEKTGLSPREFAAANIFPSLGINDSEIGWWRNFDGVEYSFHGLLLTAVHMAKFGQLYLQEGLVGPKRRLISKDWIKKSTSHQVVEDETEEAYYGYLLWLGNGRWIGNPDTGDFYCALGAGGQSICVHPELDRVAVQQRDYANFP